MKNQENNANYRNRRDRWREIDPKLLKQLPADDQGYILAEIKKDGRQQLAKERMAAFESICSRRLTADKEGLTTIIVVFIGAFTFSVAPQLIASQAGRGPLAVSAGLLGGAAASFFAHDSATRTLTELKLKHSTQQARKAIVKKQNQG